MNIKRQGNKTVVIHRGTISCYSYELLIARLTFDGTGDEPVWYYLENVINLSNASKTHLSLFKQEYIKEIKHSKRVIL